MVLEIRKSYIFLLFILLHVLFWFFAISFEFDPQRVNAKMSLVPGDWNDLWKHIIYNDESEFFSPKLKPWSRFFIMVQEVTGLSLYFGIVFYSLLNTLLFLVVEKILNVFNQKYSVVAALFIMLAPSSLVALLTMYRDIYSYMAFALILLLIVRIFSNKPLNLTKSLFFYICSVVLILVTRGQQYIHIITFLLLTSLPILFLLLLNKSYSFKNILPLLFIFLIHIVVFYSNNFKLDVLSEFGNTPTHLKALIYQDEAPRLTKHEYLRYIREELLITHQELLESDDVEVSRLRELIYKDKSPVLSKSEYVEIQNVLVLISQKRLLKSDNDQDESPTFTQPEFLKINELLISQEELLKSDEVEISQLKELIDVKTMEEFSWYKSNPDWVGNKLKVLIDVATNKLEELNELFFNTIRSRKHGNIIQAPNASLNYDSSSTLMNSNISLLISHIPISIFPPYISQISDINTSNFKKIVLLGETIMNYILVIFLFYYAIRRQKIPQISFILVLFSCMLLFCLLDSNFGIYIRHAFIFLELFFGMGLLVLLDMIKLNVNFGIRKGLL